MRYLIIFVLLVLFTPGALSQSMAIAEEDVISTQATDPNARPDAKKQGPKKQRYLYIIRDNSMNTLKGNKCFEEVTRDYGFEYLIAPKKQPPRETKFGRWMHNMGVKTILFFRNGPFWQIRLKKKYNQCKYQYGDFVG